MFTFRKQQVDFSCPKVMGILNVTPDSFSDGGKFNSIDSAIKQASVMVDQGATFIDVGGESTRPGAFGVSLQEELDRVIPVIEKLSHSVDTIISVDTSKPEVMKAAVVAGASLINDVKALAMRGSLETASELSRDYQVPVCIMHMQGSPLTMQSAPSYDDVVSEICTFFSQQIARLNTAGIQSNQILLDPGFGFGKSLDHNYQILKHFDRFIELGAPVLAGMSRKSMIGNLLNKEVNDRLAGDIAANTIALMLGASIIRVHDVDQAVDAIKIVNKVKSIS